jgi:hypothetical protein
MDMDAHQIRIEDTSTDFLLSRANDQLLIPLFHETRTRDDQLHRLNLCRLFLQVLTISDVTSGCGTKITKAAWNGDRDTTRTSCYQWPSQGPPRIQDWILWRTSLKRALSLQLANRLRSHSDTGFLRRSSVVGSLIRPLSVCTRKLVSKQPTILAPPAAQAETP